MKSLIPAHKVLDSLLLMQIVHDGPSHGYALGVAIEEKFGWKPSQTAIYNSLRSLEAEGFVTFEEKIESGRAQKIYKVTRKGKDAFEETHQNMKKNMMKNFRRTISLMQMIENIESSDESKAYQLRIHNALENMKLAGDLTLVLLREVPEETVKVMAEYLSALKKIAEKYEIEIPDDDEEEECD